MVSFLGNIIWEVLFVTSYGGSFLGNILLDFFVTSYGGIFSRQYTMGSFICNFLWGDLF